MAVVASSVASQPSVVTPVVLHPPLPHFSFGSTDAINVVGWGSPDPKGAKRTLDPEQTPSKKLRSNELGYIVRQGKSDTDVVGEDGKIVRAKVCRCGETPLEGDCVCQIDKIVEEKLKEVDRIRQEAAILAFPILLAMQRESKRRVEAAKEKVEAAKRTLACVKSASATGGVTA